MLKNNNMDQLIKNFKEHLIKYELSSNTVRNYLADILYFVKWYQEYYSDKVEVKDITSYHIQAFKSYSINTKRLEAASTNRRIQSLKSFFRFLLAKKAIKSDPTAKLKLIRRVKSTEPHSLNKSEVHSLLSIAARSAHGTCKRNYAIIQLILQTGLRIGELINLQYQDIEINERSGELKVIDGKGHKARVVPLNSVARRAMISYLESRVNLEDNSPVFLSKRNDTPTARAIQKVISNLATKANINRIKVTPHTLRHTFATNYLRTNPGCIVELSNLLGHDSLDTTAIYTKSSQAHLVDTLEKAGYNQDGP